MAERDVTPGGSGFSFNPRVITIVVVVIVLLVFAATSFFVVDATEEAVVLRFGRYVRTEERGLHFKLPLGIEQNINVATQVVRNLEFGFRVQEAGVTTVRSAQDYPQESVMLTGDLNIVDVEWIVQFRVNDPRQWLFNVEDRERTIRDISQSVVNRLVGDRSIIDVLGDERIAIETAAQIEMNEIFGSYGLGVNVSAVRLGNVVPPIGRVQDAFEDVNRANQELVRLINEGREVYNREIPRARGEAEQIVQVAQGYANARVNRANGDTARFLSVLREFNADPQTTRTRLYIEMVEEIFGEAQPGTAAAAAEAGGTATGPTERTDLIDRNLSNFLPLLNLSQQGAQ